MEKLIYYCGPNIGRRMKMDVIDSVLTKVNQAFSEVTYATPTENEEEAYAELLGDLKRIKEELNESAEEEDIAMVKKYGDMFFGRLEEARGEIFHKA